MRRAQQGGRNEEKVRLEPVVETGVEGLFGRVAGGGEGRGLQDGMDENWSTPEIEMGGTCHDVWSGECLVREREKVALSLDRLARVC